MGNNEGMSRRKGHSEWERCGDPRCSKGHYRPKSNLARWIRDNHDWSQKLLAEKVGTDASTLSKWLAGTRYLGDANLIKIALAAHVSIPFILDLRQYESEYATSSNTSFGPELAKTRAQLYRNKIYYRLYWELLKLEKGELFEVQVEDDVWITDISYYSQVYPEPAYVDVDFDEYDNLYEFPYFYSDAISTMQKDDYKHPGDYRDPNHLAQALVEEYISRGWGPNTLDRLGALVS